MSLESLRKSNSLDKLLNAVKEDSAPQEKKSYKDERLWKPELDSLAMVMQFLDFYHLVRVKICLGQNYGVMLFKGQLVNGI